MSEVQSETPHGARHLGDIDSVTGGLNASSDAPAASNAARKDITSATTTDGQHLQSSGQQAAPVLPQIPLQGLEEAARRSPQQVPQVANVQYGQHHLQTHLAPASQNARPLAPAPSRGHAQQQPIPPPYNPPAGAPRVYYPQQPGTPMLMNQCPRCGLRAGEPFDPYQSYQPTQRPNRPYYPPQNPEPQRLPPERHWENAPVQVQRAPRAARAPRPTRVHFESNENYGPPPADHPNAHLWVPPPGYVPPQPAAQTATASPATASIHSAVAALPQAPTYPPRSTLSQTAALPPLGRLPSPPPAHRPLTLVEGGNPQEGVSVPTHDAKGRRRKSNKPYRRRMSRDERRDILLMRRLGYKYEQIARYIGATLSAVNYTVRQGDPEPKHKNAGRKVRIPEELVERMVAFAKDYMEREKVCPVDKRTGRKTMRHLSYKMIRQAVFADENGDIPAKYKYTDDSLKSILNKRGVFLRAPMSQAMIEVARARGKRLWQEKLERERLVAEAAEAAAENGGINSGEGYAEAGAVGEDDVGVEVEDEDEDMDDTSDEEDAISIPSDAEDGQEGYDSDEDGIDSQREAFRFPARPPSTLARLGN